MRQALPVLSVAILVFLAGCGGINPLSGSQETPTDGEAVAPENGVEAEPTAEDRDGLSKQREAELGTDPQKNDTDGDGLTDYRESKLATDPLSADTDGDGLDDGRELFLDTDPTRSDTDGDGLSDLEESDGDTSPVLADTDNDGISDSRERSVGTNPTVQDTDGDGLPDGAEMNAEVLSGADPMQKDLFVEIDYMRDYRPSKESLSDIVTTFANAPVENPDGSTGISLHLVVDEQIPFSDQTKPGAHRDIATEYFDGVCSGYRYATVVNDPVIPDNQRGEGGFQNPPVGIAVASDPRGLAFDLVFAHELGHDLGLDPDIPGVDSTAISMETYPSTMNYNTPPGFVAFSDGSHGEGDHDDWGTITDSLDDVNSERFTDSVTGDEKCGTGAVDSDSPENPDDNEVTPDNSPAGSVEAFYEAVENGDGDDVREAFHSEFPGDPTEFSLGGQGEISIESISVTTENPSEDNIRDAVGANWNDGELQQIIDTATSADNAALVETDIEISFNGEPQTTTQRFVVATEDGSYKILG